MEAYFNYMNQNPLIGFLLTIMLAGVVFKFAYAIWSRTMRVLSIHKHGWPPAHCDADGDFKVERSDTDDDQD